MNITIGEKIKDLRRIHGITQNALANHLGVSSQSVSKWENDVSMPDLSVIPYIASYFGITIDELFSFTPNRSREMEIELYFQALYHLLEMSMQMKTHGTAALVGHNGYIHKHELNPLIREGVCMLLVEVVKPDEIVKPEIVALYLKTKGKNEYINIDENYVDCIVTGINNIQNGENQYTVYLLAAAYIPRDIIKEVIDKFYEACRINIEKNRKILCSQTVKSVESVKTDLLEFIVDLSDETILKILFKTAAVKKAYTFIHAMCGASGEVNKKVMQLIIPENDHEILASVLNRTPPEWYHRLSDFIYYFTWSDLLGKDADSGIYESQQEILGIYNQMDK